MPTLALQVGFLDDENIGMATCLQLGAVMLFPHDEAARQQWCAAASLTQTLARARAHAGNEQIRLSDSLDLMQAALSAQGLAAVSEMDEFKYGMIGGNLFLAMVASYQENPRLAHFGRIKRDLSQNNRIVTIKKIDDVIWPRMKAVAHLWASFASFPPDGSNYEFPCHLSCLKQFLLRSEQLLRLGWEVKARQSKAKLVVPGGSWQVDDTTLATIAAPPSAEVIPFRAGAA